MLRSHTQIRRRPEGRRKERRPAGPCLLHHPCSVIWLTAITHTLGVFVAEEIDAVKRGLGQVKDLAYSGQAPTV